MHAPSPVLDGDPLSLGEPEQIQFMSAHRCLRASGTLERIHMPVQPAGQSDQRFHAVVAEALRRARAAGVAHPVVAGAIPFDLAQPACLTVPRQVELRARMPAAASVPVAAHCAPADVLCARSVPGAERYKQGVRQAIANFQLSDIRKVVLARLLEVELDRPADADAIFARLCAQNPTAYQFRLPLFDGSELIGASPELLVRKADGQLCTNPLAGSAKRQRDPELDREVSAALLRSAKDLYEHRLVIEDVQRALAPLCTELNVPAMPSLLSTAAMWHLSTAVRGVLADPAVSALQVACRMHPTPALCGYPTRMARKLINLIEPFERGMFGGLVGWCDAEGNGEWAVTIRCGRFSGNHVELFAGAGIVGDSDPESEWDETQAKLQTMVNALGLTLPALDAAGEYRAQVPA